MRATARLRGSSPSAPTRSRPPGRSSGRARTGCARPDRRRRGSTPSCCSGTAVGAGRTAVVAHPEAPVGRRRRAPLPGGYRTARDRRAGRLHPRAQGVLRPRLQRGSRGRSSRGPRRSGSSSWPRPRSCAGWGSARARRGAAAPDRRRRARGAARSRSPWRSSLRRRGALEAVEILATDVSAGRAGPRPRERGGPRGRRPDRRSSGPTCCRRSRRARSISCWPTCRTSATTRWPACRSATTFEPALALDGGADGLEVIGRLLDRLPDALADDGVALLEIGADQGEAIVALVAVAAAGLVVPGRARPRRPAAGRPDRARLRPARGAASAPPAPSASVGHHQPVPTITSPGPSCPSASSPSTSTGRSSATT